MSTNGDVGGSDATTYAHLKVSFGYPVSREFEPQPGQTRLMDLGASRAGNLMLATATLSPRLLVSDFEFGPSAGALADFVCSSPAGSAIVDGMMVYSRCVMSNWSRQGSLPETGLISWRAES